MTNKGCIKCKEGYYKTNNYECEICNSTNNNCITCNDITGYCNKCNDEYYLNNNYECKECNLIDKCNKCDGIKCISCENGYELNKIKWRM